MFTPVSSNTVTQKIRKNKLLCWVSESAILAREMVMNNLTFNWILQCKCPSHTTAHSLKAEQHLQFYVFWKDRSAISASAKSLRSQTSSYTVWILHFLFLLLPSIPKISKLVSMAEVNNLVYPKVKLSIANIKWYLYPTHPFSLFT